MTIDLEASVAVQVTGRDQQGWFEKQARRNRNRKGLIGSTAKPSTFHDIMNF